MCTNSLDDDVFIKGIVQNYSNPHIMLRSILVFITPDKKRLKPVKISVAVFSKSLTDVKKKNLSKEVFSVKETIGSDSPIGKHILGQLVL